MTTHSLIRSVQKVGYVVPILAASVMGVGAIAPEAQANSLVPQMEGEVYVGFDNCLGKDCSYLNLDSLIESIESLTDSSTQTKSRLFVDAAGSSNTYGGVKFRSQDIGTSDGSGDYWFRPVAMQQNGTTPLVEKGQLEVGTFRFTFSQILSDLTVNWFDTERQGGTSYTAFDADGNKIAAGTIAKGPNNNVQETTLTGVKSIILNLGERHGGTGDGVNFQIDGAAAVPEPGLMMGLGAFAVAGGLGLRKRQSDSTAA
ncbi:LEVG family PEP-CTERM protein [Leptolyngbya iicbica]|uniref:PEP-CTERM sorting domain-containing protein n=2 Tax=Cyanophyceae TaxID=3028117 RepID=A0A4Q7EDD0_9CYAN|nr:LEVG family PEP-CTERM protein [Leptolyngbya sp. LK]RZM81764.1 PEP-CTERM sorting domain-containing protein [Leptolyngbya sp. LK]